jgi:hypothetical protein
MLKSPISRFSATTTNEAFVMRLAVAIGLDAASVELRVARGRTFLLVQRYESVRERSQASQMRLEVRRMIAAFPALGEPATRLS